jgi:type II secretory pathway component PulF
MPLDDALAASSQTLKESKRRKGDELRNGANSRDGIFQFVITGLLLIQFFILGLVLYFAAAMRLADPERIARLFAIRLRAQVVRGKSLSEAMASLSRDFDPSEVEIVRAGEGMNQLPRALANLSKFLLIRKTIGDHGSVAIYPLMIVIMLAGAAFFTAKIIPNYVSIFKQMGARSSFPTSLLFQLSEQSLFFQALMILLPLVMLLIIFRGLLNGRMMSSHILAALTLPMLVNLVAGTVQLLVTSASGYVSVPKIFESRSILLLLSLPIALMWLPTAMERIESVVRSIEQYMARILSKVPILGVGAAAEMEARWLAAFSLSIESGAAAHEAIISAGTACGGGLKTSSDAAAARVVSGVDVGEACEKAQLPPSKRRR